MSSKKARTRPKRSGRPKAKGEEIAKLKKKMSQSKVALNKATEQPRQEVAKDMPKASRI